MNKIKTLACLLVLFGLIQSCGSKDEIDKVSSNYSELLGENFFPKIDTSFYKDSMNLYPPSAFFDGDSKYAKSLDENGIPLHYLNEKEYYHPSQIASYGLDLYFEYYKTKDESVKANFLKQAEWLSKNFEQKDSFIFWEIPFKNESFLLEANYGSALTNSWCAGVLLMASQFENKEKYSELSKKAINYMFVPIQDGGGLATKADGTIWFEEYPSLENTSHVLNGYLFSIDILHLFYEVTQEDIYSKFLTKAIHSLEVNIDNYNLAYGSIYDLFLKVNKLGAGYQKLHWIQLLWVYKITGNEKFFIVAKEFYEQTTQNNYEVFSENCIDCEQHGIKVLNEQKFWYGSWSARDKEIQIQIKLNKTEELYRLNFFSTSKNSFPDSLKICFGNGTCKEFNLNNYKILGYNSHKQYETIVKSIDFDKTISTDTLSLVFYNETKKVIALRNLGVQVMNNDAFIVEYDKLIKKLIWNNRKSFLPN